MAHNKTLNINDAIIYAKSRNGFCLSKSYINGKTKLKWKCKHGHIWMASFTSMRCSNSWCKKCEDASRKLSIEDMRDIARKHGGECLSRTYVNSRSKILWRCSAGHIFEKRANDARQGGWCKKCAIEQSKHTIDECRKVAKSNGGKCLSNTYVNINSKLLWECKHGHTWKATFASVGFGQKSWCPVCAKYFDKEYVIKKIEEAGFNLLGCLPENVSRATDLNVSCKKGHVAVKNFRSIKDGNGCRECSIDKQKSSIECMHNVASARNGKCLSENYTNTNTKLKWECESGHRWYARPSDIISGGWCPKCFAKTQSLLYKIIKELFPECKVYENFRGFEWLVNEKTGRKLEIDIFVKDIGLAIEYDGEHHYKPVTFGNMSASAAKKKLKYTQKMDNIKNKLIDKSKDIKSFIRFSYKDTINKKNVKNILIDRGIL